MIGQSHDYNRALEINPRLAEAYNNRGAAYQDKGQYDRAIADYSRALEITSRDPKIYKNRALAYYLNKEYDKAFKDVSEVRHLGYPIDFRFPRLAVVPVLYEDKTLTASKR